VTQFDNFNQHDSQELVSQTLDGLHEDLNLIKKKPYTEILESHQLDTDFDKMSRDSWVQFLKRNFSFVTSNFFAQFKSEVRCRECDQVSLTFEPYQLISLSLPSISTMPFSAFLISPNHCRKALKVVLNLKYQNSHHFNALKIQDLVARIAASQNLDPQRLQLFSLGFRELGSFVAETSRVSSLKEADRYYQTHYNFLLELTDTELETRSHPDALMVIGLVKRSYDNPSYNKVVHLRPTHSTWDLHFEFFKKFAHFYKLEISRGDPLADLAAEVDYAALFQREFVDRPAAARDFELLRGDQPIPFDRELKLLDCFTQADFEGPGKAATVTISFRYEAEERINFRGTRQCETVDLPDWELERIERSSKMQSVKELLARLAEPEDLDELNAVNCSRCKKSTLVSKKFQIYNVPKNLIVHFKKLKHRGLEEMDLHVDFELDGFDITEFVATRRTVDEFNVRVEEVLGKPACSPADLQELLGSQENLADLLTVGSRGDRPLVYDCYGVINHVGSQSFGHYTAYAKNDGKWFLFDDDSCRLVENPADIVSPKAYVLFYRLRE